MRNLPWTPLLFLDGTQRTYDWGTLCSRTGAKALSPSCEAVVVVGAFDGLHVGHRALVRAACADARDRHVPCVAVTFDPDPSEVLEAGTTGNRLLCTCDRRAGLLQMGVDHVASFLFTRELAAQSPQEFVDALVRKVVRPVVLHVGSNFRFGHRGSGDVSTLVELGASRGFAVQAHRLVEGNGASISATRIRELLAEGHLGEANELLGRCHYVRGTVRHGRGEGTSFGFPTANVSVDPRDRMPAEGVYACYVSCGTRAWPAAANVGAPPTFAARRDSFLEANLLGFSGDLYGREVSVSFVRWLRASRRFDSLEELERVVLGNIDWVRAHLGGEELEVRA